MVKNIWEKLAVVFAFLFLVVVCCLLISQRISSKTKTDILFDNSRYAQAEKEYCKQVVGVLSAYHCAESGINLTREVSLNGDRSYYISIHNQLFETMDRQSFAEMQEAVAALAICAEDGTRLFPEILLQG